jgi:hypothetical protein
MIGKVEVGKGDLKGDSIDIKYLYRIQLLREQRKEMLVMRCCSGKEGYSLDYRTAARSYHCLILLSS